MQAEALALERIAVELDAAPAHEIISWAIRKYRPSVVLACSFGGPSGMVALDVVMSVDRATAVYYLDTGHLFPQTYALVQRVSERYRIEPVRVASALSLGDQHRLYGGALWERDPDACCTIRKVTPQRAFLKNYRAWISGIRRDQTQERAATAVVQWDARFGLAKVSPLAHWSERAVWDYIRERELPYNELNDEGYPSLGCVQCTRPVAPGEDIRAGRWSTFDKAECGLHTDHRS